MSKQPVAILNSSQIFRAYKIKAEIEALEKKLNIILGSFAQDDTGTLVRPRRKMSAAGRRKVAAAQRARWARWAEQKGKSDYRDPKKAKPKLTAAA